jgi:predicted CopG family antitoxin
MVITTIAIEEEIKKKLEKMKVHPREPYNDVIKRILKKLEMESA